MRNNQTTIKEALKLFLKKYHLEDKMNEAKVYQCWNNSMGPFVVNRTEKLKFHQGVLRVHMNSAPLRNELNMAKSLIIEKLNSELEEPLIKDLQLF